MYTLACNYSVSSADINVCDTYVDVCKPTDFRRCLHIFLDRLHSNINLPYIVFKNDIRSIPASEIPQNVYIIS